MAEEKGKQKLPTNKEIQDKLEKCVKFNQNLNLYDTVDVNEAFYIGDQWRGVNANGLPTPVYNVLKQVVNFLCATATSDNIAIKAFPLLSTSKFSPKEIDRVCQILNHQFEAIIERNGFISQVREMLRNAAVDADGCIYSYFDPEIENDQPVKGEIVTELIENTRVHFGNPNTRLVQKQPYIIITRREIVDDVKYRTEQMHKAGLNKIQDTNAITADRDTYNNVFDGYTDDKVTVSTYMWKNRETGTIWFAESTANAMIRDPYDSGYHLYPLTWINWDKQHDCYHGRAMVTGLTPNQKFINKMYAMVGLSFITMSFPKIIYDKTKIDGPWDASVGTAIGVNGPVDNIAKILEGAPVNPQIAQFIEMAVNDTRSFLGASDVALGDSRPDNTSAIIALQRAANTPMELTKQDLYQAIDDNGKIWVDIMSARYGTRYIDPSLAPEDEIAESPAQIQSPGTEVAVTFDFGILKQMHLSIKREVGASSYWSEMASQQTLDNLLMQQMISPRQYLERLPGDIIVKKAELIEEFRQAEEQARLQAEAQTQAMAAPQMPSEVPAEALEVMGGGGNGAMQRALNEEGL